MIKLSDYQAVIVDLDGTLYFQKPVRMAMLREMVLRFWRIREYLIIEKYRELFERGLNEQERFAYLPEDAPKIINEWMLQRPLPYVKKYRDDLLIKLLEEAKQAGIVIIVYSDYPVKEKLSALGFTPSMACSSTNTGFMKPNPQGLVSILQTQHILPEHCLVIGDREEKDGALANNMEAKALILPSLPNDRKIIYSFIAL